VWQKSNLITGVPKDCSGQLPTYLKRFWLLPSRVAVPIPAVVAASVLHSAAVGGSVAGDVGAL